MNFVIFVISMTVLMWGASLLIRTSEKIALRFGISEYIIGATLIAIGTSLPEMATSILASGANKPQIALANIIGSNIFNITLILGFVFLISKKIEPDRDFFAKDSTWTVLPVLLFILMIFDGQISRFEGVLLLFLMGAYILFLIKEAQGIISAEIEEMHSQIEQEGSQNFSWLKTLLLALIGVISILGGAHFVIESATEIAQGFGISEWIIGIVMLSLGTSLPELVVSIFAALEGKADMAIGNIIGSNMANTTLVLGGAALLHPLTLNPTDFLFDIVLMVIASLILVFLTANKLYGKPAGISLLIMLALFLNHIAVTLQHP